MLMDEPTTRLMLQFLAWLSDHPRTYGETMDAWRSTCPRLSIWEDALAEGLIHVDHARGAMRHSIVELTLRGNTMLNHHISSTKENA